MITVNLIYTKKDWKLIYLPFKYETIIDYNDIISKIIKNDINKSIPSNIIVSSNIISKLKKIFETETDIQVLYILKNGNHESIENIIEVINKMGEKTNKEFEIIIHLFDPIHFHTNRFQINTIAHFKI